MWCDIGISVAGHVIRVQGSSVEYLRTDIWYGSSLHPLIPMSLSNQHPYALFVAGGLRSPTLVAKAQVDVGDNTNTYLASADVVSFLGQIEVPPPNSGSWVDSRNGVF